MAVGGARLDRDELPAAELERHGLERERREVDPQGVVLAAVEGRELVQQPRLGADPVVLHPRAQLREGGAVGLGRLGDREQGQAQRRLERGGGGEPGAARDVAPEAQARAAQRHARGLQLGRRPAHEGPPAP